MPYEIHTAPGEAPADVPTFSGKVGEGWPMWEVFVRPQSGRAAGREGV